MATKQTSHAIQDSVATCLTHPGPHLLANGLRDGTDVMADCINVAPALCPRYTMQLRGQRPNTRNEHRASDPVPCWQWMRLSIMAAAGSSSVYVLSPSCACGLRRDFRSWRLRRWGLGCRRRMRPMLLQPLLASRERTSWLCAIVVEGQIVDVVVPLREVWVEAFLDLLCTRHKPCSRSNCSPSLKFSERSSCFDFMCSKTSFKNGIYVKN